MSHLRSLSPHALHNSMFEGTHAKNALRLRNQFKNDATAPSEQSAVALMERLFAFYQAARLDHGYRHIKNVKRGPARAYGGKRGTLRAIAPTSVPSPPEMSRRQLMFHKLCQSDWEIPSGQNPGKREVDAGLAALRTEIEQQLCDGMLPHERVGILAVEKAWGITLPRPVQDETISVLRSLTPKDRHEALASYYDDDQAPASRRISQFLKQQKKWRNDQSRHACFILSQFENDLKDTRKFPASNLAEIERRYLVNTLPPFRHYRHIQSRTARIAIAMEAASSVNGTSRNICIDQTLAAMVAAKYNAFLAGRGTARKRSKSMNCRK